MNCGYETYTLDLTIRADYSPHCKSVQNWLKANHCLSIKTLSVSLSFGGQACVFSNL